MNDSTEENTRWISLWILNDPSEYYWKAREVAQEARDADDYDILRDHLVGILKSGASRALDVIDREMSGQDYDNTDWREIADDLLG